MKTFLILSFVSALASADINVDWSRVKPLTDYPEFWGEQWVHKVAEDEQWSSFITGGQISQPHQFPFHAALVGEMNFGNALCSGSLINRRSVLTAASCLSGAASTAVFLGANDMENRDERYQARFRVPSSNFIIHPGYVRVGRDLRNDVGLVRFPHSIAFFTPAVNVVNLPTDADLNNNFASTNCIIMGSLSD